MWYVGLDWADTPHAVSVLTEVGKQGGARRFSHSPEGLNDLNQFLWSFTSQPEEWTCIVETNHGQLVAFLLAAGIPVYPVNPKTIKGLRKVTGARTDRIDAHVLAKAGYFNLSDLHRLEPESPAVQELKALTRDQGSLIQMQIRLVKQLTACLKESYPVALRLFCKVQQPATLRFLQAYPTQEAAQSASAEEMAAPLAGGESFPTQSQPLPRLLRKCTVLSWLPSP